MPAAVRTYLTTGLALMGAGFVTAAQINPPLQKAETRVVEAAVSLVAAVGNGLPCSGYNTDGCDISAPQTYTPVVLDTAGSPANIAANIINAVASIPRAFVDALNGLSHALEVTGSWWVYTPTNVLGFDPADPVKVTALVDLAIPFKPISNVVGEHLSWWAKANLPMDAGCRPSTSFSGWIADCKARTEMCGGSGRCRMMPVTRGSAFRAAMAASSSACVVSAG